MKPIKPLDAKYECLRCGYKWTPRVATLPKRCAKCSSPNWGSKARAARENGKKGGRPRKDAR